MRSIVAHGSLILVLSLLAPLARAQSSVETVERTYQSGHFRDALAAVQRTLATERLGERSLARLLELEALSHHALGDSDGVSRSLAWLAALGSSPELSGAAPPPVVAAYARARERAMQVDLELVERASRRRVELTLVDPPDDFVSETRLRVRFDGGAWIEGAGAIDVPVDARRVEGYAWVVGPARVVTHQLGSARAPLTLLDAPAAPPAPALSLDVSPAEPAQDDTVLWAVVTTSIVLAVIGGAIAVGFALTPQDDTILVPRGP